MRLGSVTILRYLAAAVLVLVVLFPAMLAASAGVDLNLLYGLAAAVVSLWLAWRSKGLGWLWLLLGAAVLAVLPYPLWVRTDSAGALSVNWSQAVFESHPWYYPMIFGMNSALMLCAFRLAAGRWPVGGSKPSSL